MKVKDAFKIIQDLKMDRDYRKTIIAENPYHADYAHHRQMIKKHKVEIERISELVYNMELQDSYDDRTLKFLGEYCE